MATPTLPFHQRIAGRIILLGVVPAMLLLGIITTMAIRGNCRQAVEAAEIRLQRVAAQIAARLDTQNRVACDFVQTMALQRAGRMLEHTTQLQGSPHDADDVSAIEIEVR
ncbi:MAG: hypothetical protein FJ270_06980 [Planctomycetes bacterium]|nr:hypothetical protein [Planctomycetota bacterium]